MITKRKSFATVAVALTAASAVAACSGGGANDSAPEIGTERYTIAMVTHEAAGDTFWDRVRKGAEDAATSLNVDLKYSNNNDATQMATLVDNAIDSDVDGIATDLAYPAQVGPGVRRAIDSGIPTVVFNAGVVEYPEYGATMFFGADDNVGGKAVGARIAEESPGGKVLCVIEQAGQVTLESRCSGVAESYPNTENIQVTGTDLPSVQQTIQSKLQQDPSITDVVTMGAPIAVAALAAKESAGSEVRIETFDVNTEVLEAIKSGEIAFTVDQQPYVQGFMAVTSLWLQLSNGNDIGGGLPVLTGPSFIDAENVDDIIEYAKNNTR